jgi:hypothetical protein
LLQPINALISNRFLQDINLSGSVFAKCEDRDTLVADTHLRSLILRKATGPPWSCRQRCPFPALPKAGYLAKLLWATRCFPFFVADSEIIVADAVHGDSALLLGDTQINVIPLAGRSSGVHSVRRCETDLLLNTLRPVGPHGMKNLVLPT